jgi:O-antigen ligase
MVSQWLALTGLANVGTTIDAADQYLDGSPFDRFLLTGLLAIGLAVLVSRWRKLGPLLRANGPLLLFFLYCGLSTLWSDYTDVAFKRWIKALGDLTMVLIVLTDRDPAAAVKRFLTRAGFLLVPASLLLIRYYPHIGRGWSRWDDMGYYLGVGTSKNELGGVCLLFGLGSVWLFSQALRRDRGAGRAGSLIAHGTLLSIALWLLWKGRTMTALTCFLMASALIAATSFRVLARRRWVVHFLVAVILSVSFSALFLAVGSGLVQTMGRDSTLTGRTEIWKVVLGMTQNPLFGTGFESFWLGPRLTKIWSSFWWHPNEAHNGYIEVYLNLGWVGLTMLAVVMVMGYRNVVDGFRRDPDSGRIRLAFFLVAVVYNFTESAIRIMHPVWILFLLAIIAVPGDWTRTRNVKKRAVALPEFNSHEAPCLEEV